ncbi:hypothetical protein ACLOJK_032928 [Asimina triloba]
MSDRMIHTCGKEEGQPVSGRFASRNRLVRLGSSPVKSQNTKASPPFSCHVSNSYRRCKSPTQPRFATPLPICINFIPKANRNPKQQKEKAPTEDEIFSSYLNSFDAPAPASPPLPPPLPMAAAEKKWLFLLLCAAFLSLFLLLSAMAGFSASSAFSFGKPFTSLVRRGPNSPPSFAYYIAGNRGHGDRVLRLLLAVYHPRNRYLLHLATEASDKERTQLAAAVQAVPAVRAFGNVDVIGKPDAMTYMGSSTLAAAAHAAAVLLKLDSEWDWFITLSAADYPLVTQDGKEMSGTKEMSIWEPERLALPHSLYNLACVNEELYRSLNPQQHQQSHGCQYGVGRDPTCLGEQEIQGELLKNWRMQEEQFHRFQPIVVDPGIYLARRTKIFHATEKRQTPEAFKVFTGSPWVILSRPFVEFCTLGWDNLPRTLLMFFTNVILSEEGYFHTVACNAPEFQNTTVNADLRYIVWDTPPGMEPRILNSTDYDEMVQSGAAFARQFRKDDPVLNQVDEKILMRRANRAAPGAWCSGRRGWWMDPCSLWGDINVVKPGRQARRLGGTMENLLDDWKKNSSSCQ